MRASTRFNNQLRYRGGDDDAQRWLTPSYVLEPVREALGGLIDLDPCTEPDNPIGAVRFYTVVDDGIVQPWASPTIFVNPPYSKAREPWITKCINAGREGLSVVLLIPAATDTTIFQRALGEATQACFIRGRVKFGVPRANGRQEAASHPSVLLGWNVNLWPCRHLGAIVQIVPMVAAFSAPRTPEEES